MNVEIFSKVYWSWFSFKTKESSVTDRSCATWQMFPHLVFSALERGEHGETVEGLSGPLSMAPRGGGGEGGALWGGGNIKCGDKPRLRPRGTISSLCGLG